MAFVCSMQLLGTQRMLIFRFFVMQCQQIWVFIAWNLMLHSSHHQKIFRITQSSIKNRSASFLAITWASTIHPTPHWLLIRTDSLDTVEMFHSLKVVTGYNSLLFLVICLLIINHISLHIFHIAGAENIVADALSCCLSKPPWLIILDWASEIFNPLKMCWGLHLYDPIIL